MELSFIKDKSYFVLRLIGNLDRQLLISNELYSMSY